MIPSQFFARCVKIERSIGKLYEHWSEETSYSEGRRRMWKKLSEDEEGHALEIEMASRLSLKNESLSVAIPLDSLNQLCTEIEAQLAGVLQSTLSDDEALKLAVELEARTASVHACNALHFTSGPLKKMFNAMGTYNEHHLAPLIKAYQDVFNYFPDSLRHLDPAKCSTS
ncbi:MAG: hypothetical protein C0620_10945 [Desulfuromonas sp.]|nr:MAG: hypothetical protein C0620_10945 [Desulfuromonas sp.]